MASGNSLSVGGWCSCVSFLYISITTIGVKSGRLVEWIRHELPWHRACGRPTDKRHWPFGSHSQLNKRDWSKVDGLNTGFEDQSTDYLSPEGLRQKRPRVIATTYQ